MSTVEKLFVQIFERRNSIIEQAKRQTELHDQHLASKLLVDGIIPPAWLWKPTSSSDSEELQKDELISQLLYPQPSLRYNGTHYSSNNDTVITGDNKEFCDGIFMGVGYASPNRHTDLVVPAASDSGHAGCAFNCVPEQILSMTSPEGQADDSFQKFQNAPDNSLARMVRSKSRQKALKLRNSANVLELQKDELISQRDNGTHYSSNNDTVITGDNKEFCDGIFMGVGYASPNRHTDLVVPAASDSGHAGCAFNCVPEQILSMTSPEGQADDSFQKFQNAPDNSLARMVRSKSRQKALKLRNSANVLGKSALVHEDAREVLSGGIRLSISSTERTYCKDDLTDLAKQYSISSRGKEAFCLDELCSSSKDKKNGTGSGRITRSGSHLKVPLIGRNSSELRHTESHKKDISTLHETNKMGSTCISESEPVGYDNFKLKLPGSASAFGQSDNSGCHITDLMCFPMKEDPCVSEDGKIEIADDIEEETVLLSDCNTRQVLKDLTNTGGNSWVPVAVQNDIMQKDDMNIARPNNNVNGTRDDSQVQLNPKGSYINYIEQREKQASSLVNMEVVQSHISPIVADETKKAKCSINNSIRRSKLSGKTSLERRMQNLALKASKGNNIVSNVSSFIPLVQKTQAANVCAGKRDVKVKSLEAAEVAKRLEEKIVNERRKRKEALKLERAKLEVENLRKMDLDKKKKEEERKKRDADIIAKKRLIDEEKRKDKERKRMRLEARQKQRGQEEKMQAEKVEKGKQHTKIDEKITGKDSCSEFKMEQNQRIWKGGDVALKKSDTKLVPAGIDRCRVGRDTSGAGKSISSAHKSPQSEDLTMQGISYDISPYRSDDENDEDEEQKPSKKYTPWASFLSVDLLGSMLQEMDPDEIFPLESFCSIDEVIISCKL